MSKLKLNTLRLFSILTIFSLVFVACDEEITIANQSIEKDLAFDFDVEVPDQGSPTVLSVDKTLEIKDNAEFDTYEALKDIKVQRVLVKVKEIKSSDNSLVYSLGGEATFPDVLPEASFNLTVPNLQEAADNQTEYVLPLTDEQIEMVSTSVMTTSDLRLMVEGALSNSPITFVLEIVIETKANVEIKVG